MGVFLARAALLTTGDRINNTARTVLAVMALEARDQPGTTMPAGIYVGGWELLAMALGHTTYTPSAEEVIRRQLRRLTAAELVERIGRDGPRGRVAYGLRLPPITTCPGGPWPHLDG